MIKYKNESVRLNKELNEIRIQLDDERRINQTNIQKVQNYETNSAFLTKEVREYKKTLDYYKTLYMQDQKGTNNILIYPRCKNWE